jgi:hypothetical protein
LEFACKSNHPDAVDRIVHQLSAAGVRMTAVLTAWLEARKHAANAPAAQNPSA